MTKLISVRELVNNSIDIVKCWNALLTYLHGLDRESLKQLKYAEARHNLAEDLLKTNETIKNHFTANVAVTELNLGSEETIKNMNPSAPENWFMVVSLGSFIDEAVYKLLKEKGGENAN